MFEITIDRDEENLQKGATFYFEELNEDFFKLIDLTFKYNKNREKIEIREVL